MSTDYPAWLLPIVGHLKTLDQASDAPILLSGPDPNALMKVVEQFVQASICEQPIEGRACGVCPSCNLFASHTHPDVQFVLPPALALKKQWPVQANSQRTPSEAILVDQVRALQGFFHITASRSDERFAVIFPFEALNIASENALLKILEEPSAGLRFVLVGHKPDALLPTIRSRCQSVQAKQCTFEQGVDWIQGQNLEQPAAELLSLAMLDPFEAKTLAQDNPEELVLRKKWVLWMAECSDSGPPSGLEKLGLTALYELALRLCYDVSLIAMDRPVVHFNWLNGQLKWAKGLALGKILDTYAVIQNESAYSNHPLNPRLALEFLASRWQTLRH